MCTPECKAAFQKYREATTAYNEQWPDACEKCKGAGKFGYSYDPSPAGVALSPGRMYEEEPCPNCAEKGICARCGKGGLPEEGPCKHCGFNYDSAAPEPPECLCWVEEEKEMWDME